MGPTRVLAALMGGLMLAGCTDGDRYENRTYAYDGWGNRSGGYYGYPSRYYGYPYRYYDNRRYYDHDHDDDDDDHDHDHTTMIAPTVIARRTAARRAPGEGRAAMNAPRSATRAAS